jgi:hypothetical protein
MRLLPAKHTVGETVIGFSETGEVSLEGPQPIMLDAAAEVSREAECLRIGLASSHPITASSV